jgi:molybdate transport system ATP-binding protein
MTTVWEVDVQQRLQQGAARFDLHVAFKSRAQRLVLFGPSGAGKTQTLRLIAGITRPDRARVVVAGRVLHDSAAGIVLSPQQRRLGHVFQDYALFPHLTVQQNIGFALHRGWLNPSPRFSAEPVERWMASFGLCAVAGQYPHQLSGGQRQRTALARALVNQPDALLLDEPFAALDKGLRQHLRDELVALQAQIGLPMLLITHDDDDLRALADEVVTLDQGRVLPTPG